jgi:hypothetical protein
MSIQYRPTIERWTVEGYFVRLQGSPVPLWEPLMKPLVVLLEYSPPPKQSAVFEQGTMKWE